MQNKEKVLDDIARVAGGTVSVLSGVSRQVREEIKVRIEDMAAEMDLVPREDLERLEALVEQQEKRIAALEKKLNKK